MRDAIVINSKDNVATAVRDLNKDTIVKVEVSGKILEIKLRDQIKLGHKFAIKRIGKGEYVIKYGEPIGRALCDIEIGEHVHIHNVGVLDLPEA